MGTKANPKPVLTFRGVRGSLPASSPDTYRYGGHTLCLDTPAGDSSMVLIDAGTGITRLGDPAASATEFHVFLTHYHWDHIQGLPFFPPLFDPTKAFTFYGHSWGGLGCKEALERALRPPWFPVSLADTGAAKEYVTAETIVADIGQLRVTSASLHHPQGVTAYRIDGPEKSVVFATDCESGEPSADFALREFATGADVLVHDAQYSPEEFDRYRGRGHSTWAHAASAALDAEVQELILISHDPARSDSEVDLMVDRARTQFANTQAAHEGLQITL